MLLKLVLASYVSFPKQFFYIPTKSKPQSLKLVLNYLVSLPDVMELLDRFCEYAKGSSDMWNGVNNKIIILDLLKLMDQNGLSLDQLHKLWIQSTDRNDLQKCLTDQIFGRSKSSSISCYKASSDFDFYRQLFVKLFDIFSQRRVKTSELRTTKKRSRLGQDYEMLPTTKRRRTTTTSSGASTVSQESVSQLSSEDSNSHEQSLVL